MDNNIKVLPSDIANKIAAGEVVQRPLSVVKELVENSIDAQASIININLQNSGLDEIEVIDNGIGMNKDNVKLCLVRHATSKVDSVEDIYRIMTLGFRGEALASIAAISQFDLLTSTDGVEGFNLTKNGDEEQKIEEVSYNKGTKISVKNLFFNTPARYKHLSSTFYELSLIVKYINKAALTNPQVKFELKNNDNVLFSTLGDGSVVNVMQKIYNVEIAKNIISFENENEHFNVKFYIVKPQITRSKNNNMYIGVNNRIIRNKAIEDMVIKGYGQYLHTNQYPIVFLDIHTDYSLIDINIHPTKEQIKISLIDKLEELVVSSIKQKLNEEEYISKPKIEDFKPKDGYGNTLNINEEQSLNNLFSNKNDHVEEQVIKEVKEEVVVKEIKEEKAIEEEKEEEILLEENVINYEKNKEKNYVDFFGESPKENIVNEKTPIKEVRQMEILEEESYSQSLIENALYIGIFHKTYILFENEEGLFLVDQHAAQERIRYEQILDNINNKSYNLQRSLVPEVFNFTTGEFLLVENKLDELKELGLVFERFGPDTLRLIEGDSFYFKNKSSKEEIRKIIDLIVKNKNLTFDKIIDEIAISIACKGSIKAHDYITKEDAYNLLVQLSNCKEPYTCPHGRPIIVNLDQYQIQKMFKRVN